MNVVALGTVACKIAELFKKYSQYKVYQIDDCKRKSSKGFLRIKAHLEPKDYEEEAPIASIEEFLKNCAGESLFVVCGAENTAALSLVVLQILSQLSETSILYIKPDTFFLNKERRFLEENLFKTLQLYVLQSYLKDMYVFDNAMVEKVVDSVPQEDVYSKVNELVVWVAHSINYYNGQQPTLDNISNSALRHAIKTIAIDKLDFEEETEEKLLFNLQNIKERRYYYILNDLMGQKSRIKDHLQNLKEKGGQNVSYGVYETKEDNLILVLLSSISEQH